MRAFSRTSEVMGTMCEVCGEFEAKYKCPRCFKRTCSLKCSKLHKTQSGCDGKSHDPTVYIESRSLKEADDEAHESNVLVQRDFNFLTNIKREVELKRRDGKTRNKRTLQDSFGSHNNARNKRGRFSSEDCPRIIRRGVNCLVLPRGMQRSMANKSKWDKALDRFVWTIEWVLFPPILDAAPSEVVGNNFSHTSHRIKEDDTLVEAMGKIIYDKCREFYNLRIEEDGTNTETKSTRSQALVKSRLKFYTKWFPYNTMQALDSKKLIELDSSKPICELFRNKTVLEFPTIFTAIDETDLPSEYSVVDGQDFEHAIKGEETTTAHNGGESLSDSDSDSVPLEESYKLVPSKRQTTQIADAAPALEVPQKNELKQASPIKAVPTQSARYSEKEEEDDDSDSDGYDPGITMDFLAG